MFVWRHSRKNSGGAPQPASCCCLTWSTSTIHTTRHRLTLVPAVGTTNAWASKRQLVPDITKDVKLPWMTHIFCPSTFPPNRLFRILPSRPSSAYQLISLQYSMPLWPLRYEEPSKVEFFHASGSRIVSMYHSSACLPFGTYARTKEISRNASVIDVEMHFDAFCLTSGCSGQSGEEYLVVTGWEHWQWIGCYRYDVVWPLYQLYDILKEN